MIKIIIKIVLISVFSILIVGCATRKTTVILVDNGKSHNAITVKTNAGSVLIDKPGTYVNLLSKDSKPSEKKVMKQSDIDKTFKTAISAAPLKPIQFLLYFKSGGNELTKDSKAKLPEILKSIKDREPVEVNVIGHADTKGSEKYNIKLSLVRAKSVAQWIHTKDISLNKLKIESYGESDLLVPTADNVSEVKNRRVELLIK